MVERRPARVVHNAVRVCNCGAQQIYRHRAILVSSQHLRDVRPCSEKAGTFKMSEQEAWLSLLRLCFLACVLVFTTLIFMNRSAFCVESF